MHKEDSIKFEFNKGTFPIEEFINNKNSIIINKNAIKKTLKSD